MYGKMTQKYNCYTRYKAATSQNCQKQRAYTLYTNDIKIIPFPFTAISYDKMFIEIEPLTVEIQMIQCSKYSSQSLTDSQLLH